MRYRIVEPHRPTEVISEAASIDGALAELTRLARVSSSVFAAFEARSKEGRPLFRAMGWGGRAFWAAPCPYCVGGCQSCHAGFVLGESAT